MCAFHAAREAGEQQLVALETGCERLGGAPLAINHTLQFYYFAFADNTRRRHTLHTYEKCAQGIPLGKVLRDCRLALLLNEITLLMCAMHTRAASVGGARACFYCNEAASARGICRESNDAARPLLTAALYYIL